MDLGTVRYERFEDLLADSDVDLGDITTPTDRHADMALSGPARGQACPRRELHRAPTREADAAVAHAGCRSRSGRGRYFLVSVSGLLRE